MESFNDKNKEIGYLYNLYCKEKKIIDESKIKGSLEEFFSNKKIDDLKIKATSIKKLGKCMIDVSWDFSKDEKKNFSKTICIMAIDQDSLAIMSNDKKDIIIDKKEWGNKAIIEKKLNRAFKKPLLRSKSPFPYSTKKASGY